MAIYSMTILPSATPRAGLRYPHWTIVSFVVGVFDAFGNYWWFLFFVFFFPNIKKVRLNFPDFFVSKSQDKVGCYPNEALT